MTGENISVLKPSKIEDLTVQVVAMAPVPSKLITKLFVGYYAMIQSYTFCYSLSL